MPLISATMREKRRSVISMSMAGHGMLTIDVLQTDG